MKLQSNPTLKIDESQRTGQNVSKLKRNAQPSFKGAEFITTGLNFLQTSPAVGATIVDVSCMGLPRSAVDFSRSHDAGIETARREFSSTGNDALLGVYGMGAAMLLAHGFNKRYGVDSHKLLIDNDTAELYFKMWDDKNIKIPDGAKNAADKDVKSFVNEAVSRLRGYNPSSESESVTAAFKGIAENDQKLISKTIMDNLKYDKLDKVSMDYLKTIVIKSTGVEDRFKIEYESGKKVFKSEASAEEMLNNIFKMTKTLSNGKVAKTFENGNIIENAFLKGLKSLNKKTAIIGIGASVAIGLCVQPFNAYLTKKKTGKSGFVGGGGEDKSGQFKLLKAEVAALGGYAALKTIGDGKLSNLMKHLQFKSLIPTINQFKFLYGATIVSRILSSRNNNELRETTFKDSMGFVNWLILGGFVSKFTAAAFEKASGDKYIKYNKHVDGASKFSWLTNSSTMTRKEVLIDTYKELGLDVMKHEGVAKTMKEMIKELKSLKKTTPKAAKALSKMRNLGLIQIAGYVYSGLVLGVGLPKLNIAMTKAMSKHEHKKQEAQKTAA